MSRDRSNRTLTVGQLIQQLSKLDPEIHVVMTQEDEPSGDYGVRSFEVVKMQRESTYADDSAYFGHDVYHSDIYNYRIDDRHDEPGLVVLLDKTLPYPETIDAEVVQRALRREDRSGTHPSRCGVRTEVNRMECPVCSAAMDLFWPNTWNAQWVCPFDGQVVWTDPT